jgi:SAM-dependent methyltransferase
MLAALNESAMIVMTSVGHRTGLFDALAGVPDATSGELATATTLDERYVREWLAALATAGVLELDPATARYRLPPEHAAWLTRAASPDNIAVTAQFVPLLGAVEDDVVHCFREGGGVPYERFGRFHEVMAEDSDQTVVGALEEHILPLAPGLVQRLENGIEVLDLGCGRGRALGRLAARFPRSSFTGYDLSPDAIGFAAARATELGLANVRYAVRDLIDYDVTAEPEAFDLVVTFDAVHDQPRPGALLAGIRRTVRPDGLYLMQDIKAATAVHENADHPLGTMLYAVSVMHCMTVSLAQGGEGLGTMWGEARARELLAAAGFGSVEVHHLEHDISNAYYLCRP